MSPRPTKTTAPVALAERILDVAWEQISQSGLDAINLRAIGRRLGITAPAIYHYYPDRPALMRALQQHHIVQVTTELAQIWQKHGVARADTGLLALCHAYRRWAIAAPQKYLVVFGYDPNHVLSPIIMMQMLTPFVQAIEALRQQNAMRLRTTIQLTPDGIAQLARWQEVAGDVDVTAVATAVTIWSRMHGLLRSELGQDIPAFGVDWANLFRFEVNAMMRELFYTPQGRTIQAQ